MRLPRKGILIRLVIYGGLLSYFGWQALEHYFAEKEAEAGVAAENDDRGLPSRKVNLPDGRSVEVLEITPEQAEQMYGVPPSVMPGEPEGGAAKTPPAEAPAEAPPSVPPADAPEASPEPAPAAEPPADPPAAD